MTQDKCKSFFCKIIMMDESSVFMYCICRRWKSSQTVARKKGKHQVPNQGHLKENWTDCPCNFLIAWTKFASSPLLMKIASSEPCWNSCKLCTKKRPDLVPREWMYHWANALVHTAEKVQRFMTKKNFQLLPHPPYSPDMARQTVSSSSHWRWSWQAWPWP